MAMVGRCIKMDAQLPVLLMVCNFVVASSRHSWFLLAGSGEMRMPLNYTWRPSFVDRRDFGLGIDWSIFSLTNRTNNKYCVWID